MKKRTVVCFLVAAIAVVLVSGFYLTEITELLSRKRDLPVPDKIVFITIDTLRSDHVGSYGYPRDTTPFFDSLAASGALFTNVFTAVPHTSPAHASMFTSLFPFQHGLLENSGSLNEDLYTMQDYFNALGYETAAFPAVKFMRGKVGFDKLPPKYNVKVSNAMDKVWYLNAEGNVDRVIEWLDDNEGVNKFFLWVHLYDVHQWNLEKDIPETYLNEMQASGDDALEKFITTQHNIPLASYGSRKEFFKAINDYDALLRFVDDQTRRLYGYMNQKGLNKNALWLICSDHGEGLGNHDYMGHGEFIYNEMLSIPMLFHFTSAPFESERFPQLARTVDIFPTLADLMRKPIAEGRHTEGTSLAPLLMSNPGGFKETQHSFSERRPKGSKSRREYWEDGELYSLQSLKSKFIYHSKHPDEFFDLDADPFEMSNIAGEKSKEREAFKKHLLQLLQSPARAGERKEVELDPETVKELEALGYM